MKRPVLPATVAALLLATALPVGTAAAAAAAPAPLLPTRGAVVPGSYTVVLKAAAAGGGDASRAEAAAEPALDRARDRGARITRQYLHALNGYTARLSAEQLAAVRADPAVAYVAPTTSFTLADVQSPVGSWGLDRIDQRSGPLDYSYGYPGTGAGVTAYVVDTGIRATHTEFTGRIAAGWSGIHDGKGTDDCTGHGSHVAGSLGGTRYGVAKQVTLVPVRVWNCTGGTEDGAIIGAVDWITAHHSGPSVANLSLTGGGDPVFDAAVQASIDSGVTYVVAAGNYDDDACGLSPARLPAAITVGASTIEDNRAGFSNWGNCLDLFAPGENITSAWFTGDNDTYLDGGTSMAAPHVAGAAAVYLQSHPAATPAQVTAALLADATPDVLSDLGDGSPNLLLHSTPGPGPNPPAPPAGLQGKQVSYGGSPTDDSLAPVLDVLNGSGQTIPLSAVTVRYWFTQDRGPNGFSVACDYTPRGCDNVEAQVVNLYQARPGADAYLQVAFKAGAGALLPNADTGLLQLRVHKQSWGAFDERDDWSYATGTSLAAAPHVTVYVDGRLAWGSEP